jgi:Na+-transporting NADH:ubiquinone oxidoreductase subunit NqrC
MKLLYLSSFIFFLLMPGLAKADALDNVANLIKQGNAKEIGKQFAANVEMTMMDAEEAYPQAQATKILVDFFAKHKPQTIKLLHKINSSASIQLGVYIVTTADKQEYRIAFTLKNTGGTMNIIEFRIEDEKVK